MASIIPYMQQMIRVLMAAHLTSIPHYGPAILRETKALNGSNKQEHPQEHPQNKDAIDHNLSLQIKITFPHPQHMTWSDFEILGIQSWQKNTFWHSVSTKTHNMLQNHHLPKFPPTFLQHLSCPGDLDHTIHRCLSRSGAYKLDSKNWDDQPESGGRWEFFCGQKKKNGGSLAPGCLLVGKSPR